MVATGLLASRFHRDRTVMSHVPVVAVASTSCCLERDEALRRQLRGAALPEWLDTSRSKLRQFEKYACNVFALPDLLANLTDKRRDPKIPTFDVVNSLFHTAVLRIPSINALEGDLKESDFQK